MLYRVHLTMSGIRTQRPPFLGGNNLTIYDIIAYHTTENFRRI